jgi:hypothetical protein
MAEPADGPPDDPDDWTHEQWTEWLQALEDEPEDPADAAPRRKGFSGSVMGLAMMGLEQGMYGKIAKPEIVVEVEADGQDDGLVVLDPEDPSKSTINVDRP